MLYCFFLFRLPVFLLVLLMLALTARPASAFQTVDTVTPDGRPFLRFDIYDQGEVFGSSKFAEKKGDEKQASTWSFRGPEIGALRNASDYWATLVGPHARNPGPMRITLGTYSIDNADALSLYLDESPYTELADGIINGRMTMDSVSAQIRAGYSMGAPHRDYMGRMEVLPHNGDPSHEANALAHEIGHAMGMSTNADQYLAGFESTLSMWDRHLYDQNGNPARPDQRIASAGGSSSNFVLDRGRYAFFKGTNVSQVLNGAMLDPNGKVGDAIPINGWEQNPETYKWFADLSHPELHNSMMSHQGYRNWTGYMEAEIAVLQDIGYTIDRKNFYGYSVYGDNQAIINTNGYSARNADGTAYIANRYNTAMMGIGLHIYGSGNTVTQQGDILSAGYGGAGIRVDGGDNAVIIDPGVRVHANGELGTGLMVAYGANHTVIHRGDLAALGKGGVGARFDFGSNVLGNLANGYRGSYITMEDGNTPDDLLPELDDPLVGSFDITGSIAGSAAAIFISDLAYVREINVMNGAALSGDVISHWNPYDDRVQYAGDPGDLMTELTFGKLPDAGGQATDADDPAFAMAYGGRIIGPDSINMSVRAGTLTYGGQAEVASFVLNSPAAMRVSVQGRPASIAANDITLESGSVVEFVKPPAFGYGPKLGRNAAVLKLEAPNGPDNQSTLLARDPAGRFAMGPYDYTYNNPHWAADGSLAINTARSFNTERGATAAVTAPLAMAVQNPVPGLLFDRMKRNFAHSAGAGGAGAGFSETHLAVLAGLAPAALTTAPGMASGTGYGTASGMAPGMGYASLSGRADGPPRSGDLLSGDRPVWLSFLNGGGELRAGNSSLWITPGYSYTSQHGRTGYDIHYPALTAGYDHWLTDTFFIGAALSGALPRYRSDDADIDGRNVTAALYGGALLPLELELGAFAAYGHTNHDQTRHVSGRTYDGDYDADSFSAGVSLGRSFGLGDGISLRPFVSYEYLYLHTDSYNEGDGAYALRFGGSHNNLHRLQSGADLTYTFDSQAFVNGRAYYSGLYGDRRGTSRIAFSMDPDQNTFTSLGDAMDENSLGLGLSAGVPLMDNLRLSFGYDCLTGKDNTSHAGTLSLTYAF